MCNVLIMSSVQAQTAGNKSLPSVTDGDYVYIEYTLKLEDGYGKIREDAIREVPREKIPEESHKAGAKIQGRTATGRVIPMTVKEVKDKTIVLDYNHPLAGKTLYFDVKIIDIKTPSKNTSATGP